MTIVKSGLKRLSLLSFSERPVNKNKWEGFPRHISLKNKQNSSVKFLVRVKFTDTHMEAENAKRYKHPDRNRGS